MNLVGGPPPKEILKLGKFDESFKVHGFVDDVRPFIARSAIYVVPLRIGGGTRLKILDAMAMGKAIVSTAIGCEGIEVTNGENILLADTPEEFLEKIQILLENENIRIALGQNARNMVKKKYHWDIISQTLDKSYSSVIS
jgi:glycosyltransferase involved in cell wall biosynthesis